MFPVLIDFGKFQIPTYGLLLAAGVLVAWGWFGRRARSLGLPEDKLFNLTFFTLLGGLLGAKLTLVVVEWRHYVSNPAAIFGTLRAAGVLVGGVVIGALVFYGYAKRNGLPVWRLGDAIAAPLAMAQSIGRLGCFCAGCCWGLEAPGHPWYSVVFTDPQANALTGVPLHSPRIATQVIQAGNDLLLALLLTVLWRIGPKPAGTVFWCYVLLYSISRGAIEFWRGDTQRGLYFGNTISTSQLFALAGILVASAFLVRGRLAART